MKYKALTAKQMDRVLRALANHREFTELFKTNFHVHAFLELSAEILAVRKMLHAKGVTAGAAIELAKPLAPLSGAFHVPTRLWEDKLAEAK